MEMMNELSNNYKLEFVKHYKVFRTETLLIRDVKQIKKINTLLAKYLRTKREHYFLEVKNILRSLENLFDFDDELLEIFKVFIVDDEYMDILFKAVILKHLET